MKGRWFAVFLAVSLVLSAGCATMSNTQKGAGIGGALGAGAGAIIGNQSGHAGEGALIGAGAGALVGALIGDHTDDQREKAEKREREIRNESNPGPREDYRVVSVPERLRGPKKIVAVAKFENKATEPTNRIGDGMADQLTDALVNFGQFVVVKRPELSEVFYEQELKQGGYTRISESAQAGKLTSAQFLVVGTITEFDYQENTSRGGISTPFGTVRAGTAQAHVGLIIRLIDTTSGQVIISQRMRGEAERERIGFSVSVDGFGFSHDEMAKTPLGEAIQEVIDQAVSCVSNRLAREPWQSRVAKVSGNTIYFSGGQDVGIETGVVFTVYQIVEEIVDPGTGHSLGVDLRSRGEIQVNEVQEKFSKANVISGKGFVIGDVVKER